MELSVVIVSYNTRDLLHDCLASVLAETSGPLAEVVVIDNASADGSAAMVAEEFPSIRLIALDENIGFGRACNLGVRSSTGTYVVLLNPDTVVHDRALERLLRFAQARPQGGLFGGRTLRADGSLEPSSCWAKPTLWSLTCFALGLSTAFRGHPWFDPEAMAGWARDSVREVDVVTGCLLLTSRATWDGLGGFDERFWMYGEDADLSLRARQAGYRPCITPDATITHLVGAGSATPAAKRCVLLRGKCTLLDKNWPADRARAGKLLLAAGVGMRAAAGAIVRRSGPWADVWRQRRTWLSGWPADPAPGAGPAEPGATEPGATEPDGHTTPAPSVQGAS